ncbi:uncharacterized protein BDZ83DRAFT_306834 [Colletotrichum acutatum]|uniref:Uncharacterized protein n=1 Tax=Glomerella acutata TaxID=27357 RepID=A0AAD8UQ97_GLOAC|nr:uncharacterized protein BDZ83DRAFT_306834 [Colletotrichum acutatum]KAK1725396.1 hypothetical protein BDZ83DRAFT_306834 [Colletotrichum acutatum]
MEIPTPAGMHFPHYTILLGIHLLHVLLRFAFSGTESTWHPDMINILILFSSPHTSGHHLYLIRSLNTQNPLSVPCQSISIANFCSESHNLVIR